MDSPRSKVDYGSLRAAREKAGVIVDRMVEHDHNCKAESKALHEFLSKKLATSCKLFSLWDLDGNGSISKHEFQEAIAALGMGFTTQVADEVFDEFDTDGSGQIDYSEYIRFALRDGLKRSAHRVMEFFRQMDSDGNGEIDRDEFRQALIAMGWEIHDPYLLNDVFDTMDADGSGTLSARELYKQLRQGVGMTKDIGSFLSVGAAGAIEQQAVNRIALRGSLEQQFLLQCAPAPTMPNAVEGKEPRSSSTVPGTPKDPSALPPLHAKLRLGDSTNYSPPPKYDILTDRASPRPNEFVVGDYMDGRARRTIQDEKTFVAVDQHPPRQQFYRTRTSFAPVKAMPWENPLPAVSLTGSPIQTLVAPTVDLRPKTLRSSPHGSPATLRSPRSTRSPSPSLRTSPRSPRAERISSPSLRLSPLPASRPSVGMNDHVAGSVAISPRAHAP